MILGMDLHGVIDASPNRRKDAMKGLREASNMAIKIFIVSGPPKIDIEKELDSLGLERGVHYDDIVSVVDHLKSKNIEMWTDDKGTWWASDEDWWSSKGNICREYNIEVLIDDSEGYRQRCEENGVVFVHIVKNK